MQKKNQLSNEAIALAAQKALAYEFAKLDNTSVPTHIFSDRFLKQMDDLRRRAFGKTGQIKFTYLYKRAIAAVVILALVLSIPMSVKAVRNTIFEFVKVVYEEFTHFFFVPNSQNQSDNIQLVVYSPSYIPEGYELVSELENSTFTQLYEGQGGVIIFQQDIISNVSANFNSEGVEVEDTTLNGYPAIFYSNLGRQTLIWYTDEYVFYVSSTLDRETVFRIAESVTKR